MLFTAIAWPVFLSMILDTDVYCTVAASSVTLCCEIDNGKPMNAANTRSPRVPVALVKAPDFTSLNLRLREHLIKLSQSAPDQGSNNPTGKSFFQNKWLSRDQLHKSDNKDLQSLKTFAEQAANRLLSPQTPGRVLSTTSMWSIISEVGLTGIRHSHKGRISCAYYVDAGSSGESDGGRIQFYHRAGLSRPAHSLTPESGLLLLFPSSLEHSVSAYTGESRRIVISINMS